jgi:hypothetical protein
MVTGYIKPIEMIIQSNGKIEDETAGQEIPDLLQMMNIPYGKIINDGRKIIKVKRTMEGIRINEDP